MESIISYYWKFSGATAGIRSARVHGTPTPSLPRPEPQTLKKPKARTALGFRAARSSVQAQKVLN